MKKMFSLLMVMALVLLALASCSSDSATGSSTAPASSGSASAAGSSASTEASQPASGGKLVVYSPSTEEIISSIIPEFEKSTGISVEIITAGTGELWKRIESEQANPICDVMWGGTKSNTVNNMHLLDEYVSPLNDELPEIFRNHENKVTFYCLDGSNLLVNTNIVGDISIKGYGDLLKPELKGKISIGDPTSSSAAYAQLTNMLLAMGGDYESETGWNYVRELLTNAEGKIGASSSSVHKSVADGEYIVAVTFEAASVGYERDGAPVETVYMEEGVVFLPGPAGIVKDCPNRENAEKFIDFILTKEAQQILADKMIARPLRTDIDMGETWVPQDKINVLVEDTEYVQVHKQEILDKYKEILTDIE